MNKEIVCALLFITSAMAKGRGGGSSSVQINDNWDADPVVKARMAFQIIWAILSLVQFVYLLKALGRIPAVAARGPYILLAVVTFFTFIYYLLAGILTRVSDDVNFLVIYQFSAAVGMVYTVVAVFQPAVVLWLIHQRGAVLQAAKGNTISPLATQVWKRIVDWFLVGITFIIYVATTANRATYYIGLYSGYVQNSRRFRDANQGLGHTVTAFIILLCIDVVISSIFLLIQTKRVQWNDLVASRLCYLLVPLFVIYGLSWLIFDIYYSRYANSSTVSLSTAQDIWNANLAEVLIEGFCRLAITTVLIMTMSLPGIQWAPIGGVPGTPGQWSNTNSKQDGSQAFFSPQQQAASLHPQQSYPQQQQQPYYPQQQQPYWAPQQPQQQQSPYSIPANTAQH